MSWYDLLIHYTSEPITTVGGVKEKNMGLFKTNTTKDHYKPTRVNVYKVKKEPRKVKKHISKKIKKKKKSEDNIIKDVRNLFRVLKKIDRDIGTLFESRKEEEEKNYYKPV